MTSASATEPPPAKPPAGLPAPEGRYKPDGTLAWAAGAPVVYAVRTCDKDRTAHGGFPWPESGLVEAPDWKPTAECGNGLHACPWGVGDWSLLRLADPHAVYQVVEVPASEVVDLGGKIKFPRCWLVHSGDRTPALCLIAERRMTWMRGDASPVSSSGDDSAVLASGSNGVAAACGKRGRAKVGPGGIIAIAYHDADGNPLGFATGAAGRDGIEANVWYEADPATGNLVRCAE